jgi:hypothetical protein
MIGFVVHACVLRKKIFSNRSYICTFFQKDPIGTIGDTSLSSSFRKINSRSTMMFKCTVAVLSLLLTSGMYA